MAEGRQDGQSLIAEYRGKFPEISEEVLAGIVREVRPWNATRSNTDIYTSLRFFYNIDFASKTSRL